MSNLFTTIKQNRIQAMKDKNEIAKSFYSTFMAEIEKEAKNAMIDPTDVIVQSIAKKMSNNILGNIKLYSDRGIDITKETHELEIVSQFIPKVMTEDQTREAVQKIVEANPTAWGGSVGPLMNAIKTELGNTVDMKIASKIARELLT